MPVGFYNSYNSSDPQKFRIVKGTQLLGAQDTPFFSSLTTISPDTSLQGAASAGVKWNFTLVPNEAKENAHLEGGVFAPPEYYTSTHNSNHYQIFQKTYEVSRSAKNDSLEGLNRQRTLAMIAFRKDINKALLTNTQAIQRDATTPGKLCGLYGIFGVHNEIDAGGAALSYDLLEDVLGLANKEGLDIDTCFGNALQLRMLNKILRENERGHIGERALVGQNYSKMTNFANTTSDIEIIRENMLDKTELVLLVKSMFAVVHFGEEEIELPKMRDSTAKTLIAELSFWYDNPYAAVRIKNLKVS